MGLSGRKTKQRIPNDPRNLAWANDANKFGAAYLAKFGWDPSGGLGVSGDGRTKALSVTQKLDMLGIGADHKNSAEGLAWKQNKDFESLLRRLNAAGGDGEEEETRMKVDGFTKGADMTTLETETPEEHRGEGEGAEGRKSKKKRKKDADGEEGEREKKKSKKKRSSDHHSDSEGETKSKKKKSKKGETEVQAAAPAAPDTETSTPSSTPASRSVAPSRHPRAAFRARHMAAKSRASTSSAALAEILGIADSGSTTPMTPSSVPTTYPPTPLEAGPSTSSSDPSGTATPAEDIKLQELTISNKSVMDYFKEKLAAKSRPASSPGTPASAEDDNDDYDQRPRMGLGASRLRQEISLEAEERRGLGGIGSGSRLSFASMFTSAAVPRSAEVVAEPETQLEDDEDEDETTSKKSKDKRKKEGKKEKKSKKEKGKDKALIEVEGVEENRDAADEKAERKRRKEEKRRRKEAEAQASVAGDVDGGDSPSLENVERKGKSKKRSKTDK